MEAVDSFKSTQQDLRGDKRFIGKKLTSTYQKHFARSRLLEVLRLFWKDQLIYT